PPHRSSDLPILFNISIDSHLRTSISTPFPYPTLFRSPPVENAARAPACGDHVDRPLPAQGRERVEQVVRVRLALAVCVALHVALARIEPAGILALERDRDQAGDPRPEGPLERGVVLRDTAAIGPARPDQRERQWSRVRAGGLPWSRLGNPQSAASSSGNSVNRSPTRPTSAISKIGASGSLLIATIVPASLMPVRCWIAPEMPTARYSSGAMILPVWPTC